MQALDRTLDGYDPKRLLIGLEAPSVSPSTIGFQSSPAVDRMAEPGKAIYADTDGHLATFAPTGAGKTSGCVLPALLTYAGSAVVFDPKGECYQATAEFRQGIGQDVFLIDPFGVTGQDADTLNPLDIFDPTSDDFVDDMIGFATSLVHDRSERDPFWDMAALQGIALLSAFVSTNAPKALRNLDEVRFLAFETPKERQTTNIMIRKSKHPAVKRLRGGFLDTTDKTASSIISVMQSHLYFLAGTAAARSLKTTTIDVQQIIDGRDFTLYLILPPERMHSHAALLRVWVHLLLTLCFRRRNPPPLDTLFLIDEAALLGKLDILLTGVSLLRSYGVRIWTFWQDLAQLESLYGNRAPILFNNASVLQHFGFSSYVAAEQAARRLGNSSAEELLHLPSNRMILERRGKAATHAARPNAHVDLELVSRKDTLAEAPAFRPSCDLSLID